MSFPPVTQSVIFSKARCGTYSWFRTRVYCEKKCPALLWRCGLASPLPVDHVLFRFYFSNIFRTPLIPSKVRAPATARGGRFGMRSASLALQRFLSLFFSLSLSLSLSLASYAHARASAAISSQLTTHHDTCPRATSCLLTLKGKDDTSLAKEMGTPESRVMRVIKIKLKP